MPFETSAETFNAVFRGALEKKPFDYFLDELSRYLKSKPAVRFAAEMAAWIDARKPLAMFTCREDLLYSLVDDMLEGDVPHVVISSKPGKFGIMIPENAVEKSDQIKRIALAKRSGICKAVTGKDFLKIVAGTKASDKSVLAISGLSAAQAKLIQDKMALYMGITRVGVDKMQDQTTTLYFVGRESIKSSIRDEADLCRMYLETAMEVAGPYGEVRSASARLEQEFQDRLAMNFSQSGVNLNKTPLYIIGSGTQYMKVTGLNFEYGHVVMENKRPAMKPEFKADALQPDYRQLLISYSSRIPRRVMTYDNADVLRSLGANMAKTHGTVDYSPSDTERLVRRGEGQIVALLDQMVTLKISGDVEMTIAGKWDEKFKHYCAEAARLIRSFIHGGLPKGYEAQDIIKIGEIAKKYGISLDDYEPVADMLTSPEVALLTSEVERIVDIQEVVERFQQEEKALQEQQREERAARRGGASR